MGDTDRTQGGKDYITMDWLSGGPDKSGVYILLLQDTVDGEYTVKAKRYWCSTERRYEYSDLHNQPIYGKILGYKKP